MPAEEDIPLTRRVPWPGALAGVGTGAVSSAALVYLAVATGALPGQVTDRHEHIIGHPIMVERLGVMERRVQRLERTVAALCSHDGDAVAACRDVLP